MSGQQPYFEHKQDTTVKTPASPQKNVTSTSPPNVAPQQATISESIDIKTLLAKAREFLRDGYYQQASENFKLASQRSPNNPKILYNYALSLLKLGCYTQAMEYFDRILAIQPSNEESLECKGFIFLVQGNYPQAKDCFNKINELSKKSKDDDSVVNAYPNVYLGFICLFQGDIARALSIFESFKPEKLSQQKHLLGLVNAGLSLANLNDRSAQSTHFSSWVEGCAQDEADEILLLSIIGFSKAGKLTNARACFDHVVKIHKNTYDTTAIHLQLGLCYLDSGIHRKAIELFTKGVELDSTNVNMKKAKKRAEELGGVNKPVKNENTAQAKNEVAIDESKNEDKQTHQEQAFSEALEECLRARYAVCEALVNEQVDRKKDWGDKAIQMAKDVEPVVIAKFQPTVWELLGITALNLITSYIGEIRDTRAKTQAGRFFEMFKSTTFINKKLLKKIVQGMVVRFRDQINQLTFSVRGNEIIADKNDGVVILARRISARIVLHVMRGEDMTRRIGNEDKLLEPLERCFKALYKCKNDGCDVDEYLPRSEEYEAKSGRWKVIVLLERTGIKLLENPNKCYVNKAYVDGARRLIGANEISTVLSYGYHYANKAEIEERGFVFEPNENNRAMYSRPSISSSNAVPTSLPPPANQVVPPNIPNAQTPLLASQRDGVSPITPGSSNEEVAIHNSRCCCVIS